MYNEKIKHEYLSTLPEATAKSHRSYFQKIEFFENKIQKDILFFSNAEFINMMKEIKGLSIGNSLYNLPGCIKRYGKWYNENYSPPIPINYKDLFTIDYPKVISSSYFKSPLELIDNIDLVIRDLTQEQGISLNIIVEYLEELRLKYNVGIGVLLLSWCGLTIEEIINLESRNVLREEGKIYIENRKVLISVDPAIMSVLSQLKVGLSYAKIVNGTSKLKRMSENMIITEEFQHTEYFLKKKGKSANYDKPISKNLINLSLSELNNNTKGITFSLSMLRENGLLYRAYQKSKEITDISVGKKNDEYYHMIFDECGQKFSKTQLNELKYKYGFFIRLIEKK